MFCTFPARRISQTSRNRNKIVGPNPSRRLCHQGGPVSSGFAFTVTSCSCSSFESWSVFANAGTSVRNFVVGFFPWKLCFDLNVPWMSVPFDVISATCSSFTCARKYGL